MERRQAPKHREEEARTPNGEEGKEWQAHAYREGRHTKQEGGTFLPFNNDCMVRLDAKNSKCN